MPSNARLAATATQPLCPDARPRRRAQNWRAVRMPRAPNMAVEAPTASNDGPCASAVNAFPPAPASSTSHVPTPGPSHQVTAVMKTRHAMALLSTWTRSAWSVRAVTVRHTSPDRIGRAEALPWSNQTVGPRGPVTAKNPTSSAAITPPIQVVP